MKKALFPFFLALSACVSIRVPPEDPHRFDLGFGSCGDQSRPLPIWNTILAQRPEAFIFLGDNVYGSGGTAKDLQRAYETFLNLGHLKALRQVSQIFAIWDDHDYGVNDGGAQHPFKDKAKSLFLKTFEVPPTDERWRRDGLYYSDWIHFENQSLQVIVLDTRSFKSPWKNASRPGPGRERYEPDRGPDKTILGKNQWEWLEKEVEKPATVKLVVSSIQVLAENHGYEKWGNFPLEQEKLFKLISKIKNAPVIFLSGDRHYASFYKRQISGGKNLFEVTASGLNKVFPRGINPATDPLHVESPYYDPNYGWLSWHPSLNKVQLEIRGLSGNTERKLRINYSASQR